MPNDLINPFGRLTSGAPVGWEFFSAAEGDDFTFAEVTDSELGECLQVTYTPTTAYDWVCARLRNGDVNGDDDLPCLPDEVQYTRIWAKATSADTAPAAQLQYEHAYAGVVADYSEPLRVVDMPVGDAVEIEGAERATQFWVRPLIYFNPLSDGTIVVRVKAQHVSRPWGDVPEFAPDPPAIAKEPRIYGFNDLTYSNLGHSAFDPVEDFAGVSLEENGVLTRQLGANTVRSWAGDYPGDSSTYDHSLRGAWFDEIRRAGLKLLPIVYVPESIEDLLTRWGDIIIGVEVQNEPNITTTGVSPDPAAYTDDLQAIYEAVKAVDPAMPVIGGSLAAGGTNDLLSGSFRRMRPYSFLDGMLDAGAANYMDKVSVHPYPWTASTAPIAGYENYGAGVWGNVEQVRSALSEHSVEVPILVTEVGYDPRLNDFIVGPVARRIKAQFVPLVRGMLERHPDIEAVFIHSLWREEAETDSGFGALTYPGRTFSQMAGLLS